MKMRILIIKCFSLAIFLLLNYFNGYGQKKKSKIDFKEKQVGEVISNHQPIIGQSYTLPDFINDFYFDSANNTLTLECRKLTLNEKQFTNKGGLFHYDTKDKNLIWSKQLNYLNSEVVNLKSFIVIREQNKYHVLNQLDGKKSYELNHAFIYMNYPKNLGMGFKKANTTKGYKAIEGVDLKTGNTVWSRKIFYDYGIDDIIILSDSTLLLMASGLHFVNIDNGKGWDYEGITGKKDYTSAIGITTAGIILGIFTGSYMYSTEPDVVRGIHSNIVINSNHIYYATKDKIVKLSIETGKIIWEQALESKESSASYLFLKDSKLYLANRGTASRMNRTVDFGKVFIKKYDAGNGKINFEKYLEGKESKIIGVARLDSLYALLHRNSIEFYDWIDNKLITKINLDKDSLGQCIGVADKEIVYFSVGPNQFKSLKQVDSNNLYVITTSHLIVFDRTGKKLTQMPKEKLYYQVGETATYQVLQSKIDGCIVVQDGTKIASLGINHVSWINHNTIYQVDNDELTSINLEQLE